MAPIFISHSTKERGDVGALGEALRAAFNKETRIFNSSSGFPIEPGTRWRDRILDAIREATVVILWGTPDALESKEVAFEIGAALALERKVIPCAVHVPPEDLPWGLSELQAVTLDSSDGWQRLTDAIANALDYKGVIQNAPLVALSRNFTAPSDALLIRTVGFTIELRNSSPSRIVNIQATVVTGPEPEWLQAVGGISLEPDQATVLLRDAHSFQKVSFTWTDVAGMNHTKDIDIQGVGQ
jgi:hypothetical protein